MPDFIDVENLTVEQQQAFRDAIKTPWASGQNNLRATFFDELPIGEQIIVGIDVDGEFNQAIVIPYNEPGGVPQIDDEGIIHARVSVVGGTIGEIQDEVFPKNELVIEWHNDTAVNLRVGDGITPGGQVLATQPNQITGDPRPGNTLTSPVARQWFLNGEPVSGETGYTFEVPDGANPGDEIQQLNSNIIRVKPMAGVTAIRIDTRLPGSADDNFILSLSSTAPENSTVYWGDGTSDSLTTGGQTAAQHQYPEPGIYTLQITGLFSFRFNGVQDCKKVIEVVQWSDTYPASQTAAFTGCTNLRSLPDDMSWDNVTAGSHVFNQCSSLKRLPHNMTLASLTNGWNVFQNCTSLEYLPEGLTLSSITNGEGMFHGCQSLKWLPAGVNLSSLTNSTGMFRDCISLEELPSGIGINHLVNGQGMFYGCSSLRHIPDSVTLDNLETNSDTFNRGMFQNCTSLETLPANMSLPNLQSGFNMFSGCTLSTESYSNLLQQMSVSNTNENVTFHAGNSKYNGAGAAAKSVLTGNGWVITDGGPE